MYLLHLALPEFYALIITSNVEWLHHFTYPPTTYEAPRCFASLSPLGIINIVFFWLF